MMKSRRLSALEQATNGRLKRVDWRRFLMDDVRQGALPGLILSACLIALFFLQAGTGGPLVWGLSRRALADGQWQTLGTHALAHAGGTHLWFNIAALLAMTIPARKLIGNGASGVVRYGLLLSGAGAASAATYLLLHPNDGIPMVGASGAICGLWGLLVASNPETGKPRPLGSKDFLTGLRDFVIANALMFGILFMGSQVGATSTTLAWEAHLGGFLFGLLVSRLVIVRRTTAQGIVASSQGDQQDDTPPETP